jgi:hypothetical protein
MTEMHLSADDFPVHKVQVLNWVVLGAMSGVGWAAWSLGVAMSILIGGTVANISFLLLKKDLVRLLSGPLDAAKVRFFMKYYARLSVVVLILFLLVKLQQVNTVALLGGLSTVLISISFTVAGEAKKVYCNMKEAS